MTSSRDSTSPQNKRSSNTTTFVIAELTASDVSTTPIITSTDVPTTPVIIEDYNAKNASDYKPRFTEEEAEALFKEATETELITPQINSRKDTDFKYEDKKSAEDGYAYYNPMRYMNSLGMLFQTSSGSTHRSFHKIEEIIEKFGKKIKYILKHNPAPGIFCSYKFMPQIEAGLAASLRILCGKKNMTKVHPILKNHEYTGVAVEKIDNFKAVMVEGLTESDLKNDELVKKTNKHLFYRLALGDDDAHSGNMSKKAEEIDTDMFMYTITYECKASNLIDWSFRKPTEDQYIITKEEFLEFPDIKKGGFWWPTKPRPVIPSPIQLIINKLGINISKNEFKENDNIFYKKLKTIPAGQYGTRVALLKFLLTDKEMYRNSFKLNLDEEDRFDIGKYKDQKIIDTYVNAIEYQLNGYKKLALETDEFYEFLHSCGDQAIAEIINEFTEDNEYSEKELVYYKQMIEIVRGKLKLQSDDKNLQEELEYYLRCEEATDKEIKLTKVDLNLIYQRYVQLKADIKVEYDKRPHVKPLEDLEKSVATMLEKTKKDVVTSPVKANKAEHDKHPQILEQSVAENTKNDIRTTPGMTRNSQ